MNRRTFRKRWIQNHAKYEKRGLAIFRKHLRLSVSRVPFDNLAKLTYQTSINFNINEEEVGKAFFNLYLETGLRHGKKVGRAIQKELNEEKNFEPTSFESEYRQFISNWIIQNGGQKITSVTEELKEYIIKFIADRIERGQDIREITRELQKHIKSRSFYHWQIHRIVRTETTAAANQGAIQAGNSSRIVWEKEWVSSRDARTRRKPDDLFDHYEMDRARVDKEDKFNVNGDLLEYPGDPKGHPANVINCRCTVAVVPKRDVNGKIIRIPNSVAFQL